MIQVPKQFQPHIRVDYPPNNDLIFEEWFYQNYNPIDEVQKIHLRVLRVDYNESEYLPIFWTSYYVNNNYGNDKKKLQDLQSFIDSLDKSKKYFTIVQYDDGILNDVSGLDLKVFGMGGGKYDYPLPLISKPHPYSFTAPRDIFCNFIGGLTHQIRKDLIPIAKRAGYFVSTKHLPIEQFCMNLSRSVFTLCPRGYGDTSFRIMEAIQYGSIPVYISDKPMFPHNRGFEYGVFVTPADMPKIDGILKGLPESVLKRKQEMLPEVFKELFSYDGCRKLILENIGY